MNYFNSCTCDGSVETCTPSGYSPSNTDTDRSPLVKGPDVKELVAKQHDILCEMEMSINAIMLMLKNNDPKKLETPPPSCLLEALSLNNAIAEENLMKLREIVSTFGG